jgi:transposase
MWKAGLLEYNTKNGLEWEWQAIDGAMTKAPLGGSGTGANPTDRGKKGTKRSILTDGKGIPLSVTIDGANRHDKKLVKRTLDAIILERPFPDEGIQNMCMDKGYDFPDIRELVKNYGYTAHIKSRGEENIRIEIPGFRARRWVVERTHSWLNRFRRLLIRWEKKIENYLAMLHLACAWITFKAAGLFG